MKKDNTALALMSLLYGQNNTNFSISDLDELMCMADNFDKENKEEVGTVEWVDSVAIYYNRYKPLGWCDVPMVEKTEL